MITKTQQKKLRKGLGFRYSTKIRTYLAENNIFNKNGAIYSVSYINHIFTGRSSDEKIEKAIFMVYKAQKEEQLKSNVERKLILNKKPKADTLGS